VNTYGAQVFEPDYSAIGLAAKMLTNSQSAFYVYKSFMVLVSTLFLSASLKLLYTAWAERYKTFYGRNLQIFEIS
jgi:hypothetical protein